MLASGLDIGDNASAKVAWQEVAKQKLAIRQAAIDPFLRAQTPTEDQITNIDELSVLCEKLRKGEYTATEVITAYIVRAATAHKAANCLTEVLFEDALKQAAQLDEFFATHGRVVGPFHGIPISVKDQFNIKGVDTTLGYVGRAFAPVAEDAVIVQTLRSLGAVVLTKTNIPQSIMWGETDNPLWGLTTHPTNGNYTPGGSSGGEAVMLAMKGSMIGWGTDLGGSIRQPCSMLGLYGLKPSSGRLPYWGVPVSTEGQEHVHSVVGPMTRSLPALTTVTKAVIDSQPWLQDPRCITAPWKDEMYRDVQNRPLVIGLLLDDGIVLPHPPIQRALLALKSKMEAAGHQVIPWDPKNHQEVINIQDLYYTADGGEDIRRDVQSGGEPFIAAVEKLVNRGQAISV